MEELNKVIGMPFILFNLLIEIEESKKKEKINYFSIYSKELIFAIVMGLIMSSTFFSVFNSTGIMFITKDINDDDETALSKKFLISYAGADLVFKFLVSGLGFFRYRKMFFCASILVVIAGWVGIMASYIVEVSF